MYQVNLKVVRKEGNKPKPEVYLVEAVSLTDIDVKLNKEFKDTRFEVSGLKALVLNEIFETGEGTFWLIKLESEDLDSKTTKEVFLQEAESHDAAEKYFENSIKYGEITDINKTKIMSIIR